MKSIFKFLMLAIGMIAFIGVGQARNGPPKNANTFHALVQVAPSPVVKVVNYAPAEKLVVTAIEVKRNETVKAPVVLKSTAAYYCIAPERSQNYVVTIKKVFFERDVSKVNSEIAVIPRCRSSDLS